MAEHHRIAIIEMPGMGRRSIQETRPYIGKSLIMADDHGVALASPRLDLFHQGQHGSAL